MAVSGLDERLAILFTKLRNERRAVPPHARSGAQAHGRGRQAGYPSRCRPRATIRGWPSSPAAAVYTNAEMEAWLERVMAFGVFQVDICYFISMPGQDARSVQETVDCCNHVLHKFRGKNITPMMPDDPLPRPGVDLLPVPRAAPPRSTGDHQRRLYRQHFERPTGS
jgi:hypothetical protein